LLPQDFHFIVAGSRQDHQFGELIGLAQELWHPINRGRIYQAIRSLYNQGAWLAIERPAKSRAKYIWCLGPEDRSPEG
jgi:hypothetical protein